MSKTVEKLNLYLVNLNVLYRKVQNYHWNVIGKGFFTIHAKLEDFYDGISEQIDEVAERILSVGGRPYGTLKDYLELTTLKEAENKEISVENVVNSVKSDFEAMLNLLKETKEVADSENDYGTSAMLDEYISEYEKNLWMLNAYLK
ncbi:DNA starvation/stationary phase protection protein [Leptotrichia sp. OH3620_COT-345]|uniref:Dps family protein n=1 Tax=Leptotrichia sp. OH3620_COT-345 TaxID=2491048 RepID=UPI000F645C57|nr:DNA starvation/stationary phase protection protein [Leptotrichia sp. OH3620_COT-345]RRD39364.1 DNA starvation/stationary phase protection protein [Leptotrichia sp. OH3620_COT-345]